MFKICIDFILGCVSGVESDRMYPETKQIYVGLLF